MSIQSEITRISNNVQNTIDVIEQTGVSVPAGANSDALPSLAQSLANDKQDKLTGTQGQIVGFDQDGNAVAQDMPESGLLLTFGAQSVATSAWATDTTYEGWGFRAAVALDGVTADYVPSVTFGIADATGGNLAPVAETYAGGVYIYAKEQPTAAVSVTSVVCVKGV